MEYDTKTRKSASDAFLWSASCGVGLCRMISTRQYGLLYALRSCLEETMLMFACFAVYSSVAHGGQELFRVLLRPGQMAHYHGMTPSAFMME
jgi:hypothetical protein